ncbi:MAG: response regulator [Spirochaetes bacterium]|nr:response regulator [Spirochaetota bacterium]
MNVIYIDDEEILLEVIKNYYQILQWNTDCYNNATDGLSHLKDKDYSLVLIDYNIPDIPIDDVIAKIRNEFPDMLIVVTSGESRESIHLELGDSTRIYFLKKPFTIPDLINLMKQLFPEESFPDV